MQSVTVRLTGSLRGGAGGRTEFEVETGTINQILVRLRQVAPELEPVLDEGVAVAVDGVVYRGDFSRRVEAGSEVLLLAPIVGG